MEVLIGMTEEAIVLQDIDDLKSNRRFKTALKRLNAIESDNEIHIHYEPEETEILINEIISLLKKFSVGYSLSDSIKKELEGFMHEEENFLLFSTKAKQIRDDEFNKVPALVTEFDEFKSSLQQNMVRRLYKFQILSSFHLAFSQNACNFAVPGAGKTSIVYGAYAYLKNLPEHDKKHVDKLLVIGPLSSFAPWENEYEACFGMRPNVQRISGEIPREIRKEHLYSGNPAEITIISHAGVSSLENEIKDFLKVNKTMIVVDEAHRIKNPDGVWATSILEISKEAKARVILTGTPVPNGYEDIYNLYKFIYPFKYKDILKKHINNLYDMSKNDSLDSPRVKEFVNNISPYFIRIKKSDLKLPPIDEEIITVDMDAEQRKIYDFIETKYINSFKDDPNATAKDILNRAKLIRLRQAATNPALLIKPLKETLEVSENPWESDPNDKFSRYNVDVDDSEIMKLINSYESSVTPAKFIVTKGLLEKILVGNEKVIIWTIFIQNAKELQKYLIENDIKVKLLIGEVPQEDREVIISKFNDPKNDEFNVIIANPFSVSESISLHKGCHNAIYLERDYNCAMFLQSKDRIHRVGLEPGQKTNYYYIVAKDSIDTVINTRLDEKAKRMSEVIDSEIPLLARLDNDDETDIIKDLLEDYAKRS